MKSRFLIIGRESSLESVGQERKKKAEKMKLYAKEYENLNITSEAVDVLICWNDLDKWM